MSQLTLLTGIGKQKCKVSSTLNRSSEFSWKNMFDADSHHCWNSDQGQPQSILLSFEREVQVHKICLAFQGGFVGQDCEMHFGHSVDQLALVEHFYPEDVNDLQEFPLEEAISTSFIKLVFPRSTDFYGRITVYTLQVYGYEVGAN